MPKPDPIPALKASSWQRFRRIMRWMALVALLTAIVAVVLVARGEEDLRIHMLIATALGSGLSVLLCAALMTLVFLSAGSGHDEEAHNASQSPQSDKDQA